MFFADPVAAFANLAPATRPDGRPAILVRQPAERNERFLGFTSALAAGRQLPPPPPGAPSPFALGNPERVRRILQDAGWTDVALTDLAEPMYFGADPDTATDFVAGLLDWLIRDLDGEQRRTALDDLHAAMSAHPDTPGCRPPRRRLAGDGTQLVMPSGLPIASHGAYFPGRRGP